MSESPKSGRVGANRGDAARTARPVVHARPPPNGSRSLGGGGWPLGGGGWPLGGGGWPLSPATFAVGLGWHPDMPDQRDLTLASPEVRNELGAFASRARLLGARSVPAKVDLSDACSPVEDQGSLGACTAHAVIGLVEYLYRRAAGEELDLSRLFLYRVTRRLLGWHGDTGGYIRTTIKAMVSFGAPPEEYWPYDIRHYEDEPEAFLYAFAASFKAMVYARLDPYVLPGTPTPDVLQTVKRTLSDGFPVAFGFPVYSSTSDAEDIPLPSVKDKLVGGHAVLAVGYDDDREVKEVVDRGTPTSSGRRGALLIRNSWGTRWGDKGYGWLPYDFVNRQLAQDFWTIFRQDLIPQSRFEEGAPAAGTVNAETKSPAARSTRSKARKRRS